MLPATTQGTDEKRAVALLKAVGLDRVAPEQREIALAVADRYQLDLLLGHLQLIDGKPYVTHKGLLHIAHRSGVFDGIEDTEPRLDGGFWRCTSTVHRKDMARGFTMPGRYPERAKNAQYGPEMSMVRAECLALRRAFDVSAPIAEERWAEDAEQAAVEPGPRKSLAELARVRAEAVTSYDPASGESHDAAQDAPQQAQEPDAGTDTADESPEPRQAEDGAVREVCGAESDPALGDVLVCVMEPGHDKPHTGADGSRWPNRKGGAR